MQQAASVAIFWDYEHCSPTSNINGYEITNSIRTLAHTFGSVILFKAYLGISSSPPRPSNVLSELQASGVSLTDCPRKDAADNTMIVDMITYAIDHPAPTTILVISDNQDYAYAISILRLRKYRVVVVCPSGSHASLFAQASDHLDWNTDVLGQSPSEDSPVEPSVSNARPQVTPPRPRTQSTSGSVAFPPTPAISRTAEGSDKGEDDDELFFPHGPASEKSPFNPTHTSARYTPDPLYGRHSPVGPSWIGPKAYSSPASLRSIKTAPPLVPPADGLAESTFTFHTRGMYGNSNSNLSLPKGFPIDEPEPITLKEHPPSAENLGEVPSWSTRSIPQASRSMPKQPSASTEPTFVAPTPPPPQFPPPPELLSGFSEPILHSKSAQVLAEAPPSKSPPIISSPVLAPATVPFVKVTTPTRPSTPTALAAKPPAQVVLTSAPPSMASGTPQVAPGPPKPAQPPPPTPAASSTTQSAPAQPTNSAVPAHFKVLVDVLEARSRSKGQIRVARTDLGTDLAQYQNLYGKAGVSKFAAYIGLAHKAGIVDVGGGGGNQWVMLHPEWSAPPGPPF